MQYLPILGRLNSTKSTNIIPGDPAACGVEWLKKRVRRCEEGEARRAQPAGLKKIIFFAVPSPLSRVFLFVADEYLVFSLIC
ncbi:hypothetical protein Mapa_001863 [Marchantia paleacea]|nr:hypothetical protein Mapa_001863 [Marchantia paleacea]